MVKIMGVGGAAIVMALASFAGTTSPVYDNSKIILAACDAVWPAMLTAVTKNGFVPVVSDRAGGILQAQSGITSKYRGAKNDMKALTVNRSNFWTAPEAFMVQGAGVSVVPSGNGCLTTVQVQYAALKVSFGESMANAIEDGLTTCRLCPSRPLAKNWIRLQSNGRLESMILAETEQLLQQNHAAIGGYTQDAPTKPPALTSPVQTAPVHPPAQEMHVVKPWEVLSPEGSIADNNGSVCHYAWKLSIKNDTDHDLTFAGSILFVDREGSSVDASEVVGLRVAAHSEKQFTGSKMMLVESAQTIVKPTAQLSEK